MTIVQRACAGEKVQILLTIFIIKKLSLSLVEYAGKSSSITLNFGFDFIKNFNKFYSWC